MSLLFLVTLLVQNAAATYVRVLPESSYYQGSSFYGGGRIDFAVYDTDLYPEEFEFTPPGENPGQYIYAYQIFHSNANPFKFKYFGVTGIGEGAINSQDVIGSQDDGSGEAVEPLDEGFPGTDFSKAYWDFTDEEGEGILLAGEHSYFLIYSSDNPWTTGTFELTRSSDDTVPVSEATSNPEPATVALLGIGSVMFFARRKKSV